VQQIRTFRECNSRSHYLSCFRLKKFLCLVPPIGEHLLIAGHYQAENNVSTCFFCFSNHKATEDNPYDTLKKVVIGRLSDSQEKRVQQLLLQVELGDRTPSQLLRHMRSLLGETRVDDVILRQLWIKRLPANMATCLAINVNRGNLDELAEAADKIQELSDGPCVQAVETPTPNRVITQQSDVLTKLLEKLELLVPNVSSQSGSKQRLRFSKKSDSSPRQRN
ncbi:unnamed protein product, partial [Hymenolepis diminuta]